MDDPHGEGGVLHRAGVDVGHADAIANDAGRRSQAVDGQRPAGPGQA